MSKVYQDGVSESDLVRLSRDKNTNRKMYGWIDSSTQLIGLQGWIRFEAYIVFSVNIIDRYFNLSLPSPSSCMLYKQYQIMYQILFGMIYVFHESSFPILRLDAKF